MIIPPLIILSSLYAYYTSKATASLFYLYLGIFSHILSLFLVKDALECSAKVLSLGEFMKKITEMRMASEIRSSATIDLMNHRKLEEELKTTFDSEESRWIDVTIQRIRRISRRAGVDSE